MQHIKEYIIESQNFLVNKKLKSRQKEYKYFPQTTEELQEIIIELLHQGETDLNCIDTSKITKMDWLFNTINDGIKIKDINISDWDVSNVTNMSYMFENCTKFNSDLSKWNVSKVKYMAGMFENCKKLNCDLSKWDVSNVLNTSSMFENCELFNSDLSKWNISNIKMMDHMFNRCKKFNSDLSKWDVSKVIDMDYMFFKCTTLKKNNLIPTWYTGEV